MAQMRKRQLIRRSSGFIQSPNCWLQEMWHNSALITLCILKRFESGNKFWLVSKLGHPCFRQRVTKSKFIPYINYTVLFIDTNNSVSNDISVKRFKYFYQYNIEVFVCGSPATLVEGETSSTALAVGKSPYVLYVNIFSHTFRIRRHWYFPNYPLTICCISLLKIKNINIFHIYLYAILLSNNRDTALVIKYQTEARMWATWIMKKFNQ